MDKIQTLINEIINVHDKQHSEVIREALHKLLDAMVRETDMCDLEIAYWRDYIDNSY